MDFACRGSAEATMPGAKGAKPGFSITFAMSGTWSLLDESNRSPPPGVRVALPGGLDDWREGERRSGRIDILMLPNPLTNKGFSCIRSEGDGADLGVVNSC